MISSLDLQQRSLLFATLAEAAYHSSSEIKTLLISDDLPFDRFFSYDRDGAQAYCFFGEHDIVIACRGTEPGEFNDIAADLKAALVLSSSHGRVHRGFKSECDDIWDQICNDLQQSNRKKSLWFCGHSLGGAMATILASRCEDDCSFPAVSELYTFGSPRVGNATFVSTLSVPHYRWVRNNDIVTRVPPAWLGYRHDGTELYINSRDEVANLSGWAKATDRISGMLGGILRGRIDSMSDHSMSGYREAIKKWVL